MITDEPRWSTVSYPPEAQINRPPAALTRSADLSIIIVNWHSAVFLGPCLESVYEHLRGVDFEVIVVDNASNDGSRELVAKRFPQTIFVQSDKNLGFAGANNLGFSYATGGVLLLLNPDTVVLDDAVQVMFEYLSSEPSVGAVGCRVVNADLTLQTQYVQAFPTILNQILGASALQRRFPRWKMWGVRPILDSGDEPVDVAMLAGSCIMIRRDVFEQIGLFSREFWMFVEDVDLCYKVRRLGYSIRYLGSKRIIHYGGQSTAFREESHFSTVMQKECLFKFFRNTRGRRYAQFYRAAIAITALVRLGIIVCVEPVTRMCLGRNGLSNARLTWFRALRWACGLERWVEKVGA